MRNVKTTSYSGIDNLEVMREAVNYNRFLVHLILKNVRSGYRIADFGAGSGTFAAPVRAAGHDVTCIEPDPSLGKHLSSLGFDVENDLEAIPDGSLDYLYSLNVLEHIAEDVKVIDLWSRKLRPGGRLLVYVPAFDLLFSAMDRKVGHFRRYRRARLVGLLQNAGLAIDRCRYVDSLGFPATLAYKLLGGSSGDVSLATLVLYDRIAFPLSRFFDFFLDQIGGKNLYAVATKRAE